MPDFAVLKKTAVPVIAVLFLVCGGVSWAAQSSAAESGTAGKSAKNSTRKENAGKSGGKRLNFTPYRPTERIRADQAVAFPVDI